MCKRIHSSINIKHILIITRFLPTVPRDWIGRDVTSSSTFLEEKNILDHKHLHKHPFTFKLHNTHSNVESEKNSAACEKKITQNKYSYWSKFMKNIQPKCCSKQQQGNEKKKEITWTYLGESRSRCGVPKRLFRGRSGVFGAENFRVVKRGLLICVCSFSLPWCFQPTRSIVDATQVRVEGCSIFFCGKCPCPWESR